LFTCSSHAVGKAIVEILNNFNLNCDQKKITDDLINLVQPDLAPVAINKFNTTKFDLQYWNKDQIEKTDTRVTLVIQHQALKTFSRKNVQRVQSAKKPDMTVKQLGDHNMKMMAVYEIPNGTRYRYHAVYVNTYRSTNKKQNVSYFFECVNSWGDKTDPTPFIPFNDIESLYYVTLFEDLDLVEAGATKEGGSSSDPDHMKQVDMPISHF